MIKPSQEIIQKIKEEKENVENVNNIPRKIPISEKGPIVHARQEISTTLQRILDFAEGIGSAGEEKKKLELTPPH